MIQRYKFEYSKKEDHMRMDFYIERPKENEFEYILTFIKPTDITKTFEEEISELVKLANGFFITSKNKRLKEYLIKLENIEQETYISFGKN